MGVPKMLIVGVPCDGRVWKNDGSAGGMFVASYPAVSCLFPFVCSLFLRNPLHPCRFRPVRARPRLLW